MEIKGSTTYTNEIFIRLAKFSMFKSKFLLPMVIVAEVILVAVAVLYVWAGGLNDDVGLFVALIVLILFFPFIIFGTPLLAKAMSKKLLGIENIYTFTDEGITITQKSDSINGQMEMKYPLLDKVYETKDCFYIYLTKMQSFPLLKSGVEDGKMQELQMLLKEKLGTRLVQK